MDIMLNRGPTGWRPMHYGLKKKTIRIPLIVSEKKVY
jgi:hypothetical protein